MNEQTRKASQFLTDLDIESYSKKEDLVDLMDIIAADRGWFPLIKNEEMTVTFNEKQYKIKRIK